MTKPKEQLSVMHLFDYEDWVGMCWFEDESEGLCDQILANYECYVDDNLGSYIFKTGWLL